MTIIQLYTHGQTLFQKSDAVLAAGDRETVRLLIETDPEWAGFDLYAVFWRDGETDHAVSVPLCEAGCCLIPALLLAASGTLHIALLGRDAMGRVKTSTPIRYRIRPGAPDGEGVILADVSDAAATPDQVLAGVTFYAGGEEMQTGAIPTFTEGDVLSDEIIECLTVAADFSEGDQTVTAEDGAPMRAVTVQKPDTLAAAYIARGINIAGVEGTLPTLPEVTEEDNGKTLSVVGGAWSAAKPTSTLPAVTASDNGKVLSVVGGAWAAAEAASGEIPFFDLAEMGLPEVPSNGTTANLSVDTTEIKSALDNGCVKFAVNAKDTGRVEIVMNKYSVDAYGIYLCLYNTPDGAFMLMIADGAIQASIIPLSSLPAVSETDNGKVLGVSGGAWAAITPVSGGVASWNTLTDRPFGDNEDGTVTQLDNKYLSILEFQDGGETDFIPEQTFSGFAYDEGSGAYVYAGPAGASFTAGETYIVVWDGVSYTTEATYMSEFGTVALGNLSLMGGEDTGEPFMGYTMAAVDEEGGTQYVVGFGSLEEGETHTIRVYQRTSDAYLLKEEYLPMDAIKTVVDDYINEALGGDY